MIANLWLMLSTMFYSLQLSTGSFPKPLTAQEEQYYLERSTQGDLEACEEAGIPFIFAGFGFGAPARWDARIEKFADLLDL